MDDDDAVGVLARAHERILYLYMGTGNDWTGHRATTWPPTCPTLYSTVLLVTLGATAEFGSAHGIFKGGN